MKNKVELVIVLDQSDNVQISTTTKNLVTNLGMIEVAKEIVKQLCGGNAQEVQNSPIIQPNKRF